MDSRARNAIDRFGALDILVNNAAMTISKSVWDIPAAEWDDVMAVNLRGVFFGCRVAGAIDAGPQVRPDHQSEFACRTARRRGRRCALFRL